MLNVPRRHFLPWDRPLLPQAVAWLAREWKGSAPLDLTRTAVVVPTRQSGRRLREALADYAARRGSVVFPPRVVTPEALVAEAKPPLAPSRLQGTLAWIEILRAVDLDEFREVFPIDPPARNFAWASRLADQFTRLQQTLGENQLSIGNVPGRVDAGFPEQERWAQLAELERRQQARLAEARLTPLSRAEELDVFRRWLAAFTRVVLVGTADPMAAAVTLLAAQTSVAVEVLVHAPEDRGGSFDAWGRPVGSSWNDAVIDLPDFETRVHLCADPSDQAARIAELAAGYADGSGEGQPDRFLGVGNADPDVAPLVAGEAARLGVPVFNPEGRRRRDGSLWHLLDALGDGADASFAQVEALARCPDVQAYVKVRCGPGFSAARLLDGLDTLRREHLPATLAAAQAHASGEIADALRAIGGLKQTLAGAAFPHNLVAALAELFRDRVLDLTRPADRALQDAAAEWTELLRECDEAARLFPTLAAAEWRELALRTFGERRQADEKPAGALELQGWLELLFEDAPHLVVAGFNDGFVPEAVTEDAFLPDSLRARLGLKTNADRAARDAYLLQAIAASRRGTRRLDVLFGKTSAAGDPLRPSRLLLRCPDNVLPQRVAFLFRTPEPVDSHLPWTRAWKLKPRVAPPPKQVAVTALKRWLVCPFRFYLQYALRMQAVDAAKSEMDAFDFGTLCHAALEAMGRDPAMRECSDPAGLREFLLAQLTRRATAKYGAELSLPLLIQLESARQRLGRFAEVQARERADGWRIQAVEQAFAVDVGGVTVRGKVDRIDRHETSGAVRVLDYKTSDAGIAPGAAHLRPLRADDILPEWAVVDADGRRRVWADLQLPLYRHALAPAWGGAIALGYVTLPKAIGETTVAVWEEYSPELHAAAMRCAEGVCGAIARGEFWPPNEAIRAANDEFATLFHHGAAESVER